MAMLVNTDATARFLEALEAFRTPVGEGMRADVRGPAPQALVDEFRALMDRPMSVDPAQAAANARPPEAMSSIDAVRPIDSGLRPETIDRLSAQDLGVNATNGVRPTDVMTPVELMRLQFSVNMHHFELKTFSAIRQQATSQFEEALKRSN